MSEKSTINYNVTKPLREFFTYNNIDKLKSLFFEVLESSGNYNIDYVNLIGSFPETDDFGKCNLCKFTFEDYLKNITRSLYEDIEKNILEFHFEHNKEIILIRDFKFKIKSDLNGILNTQKLLFNKYPFLKKLFDDFIFTLHKIGLSEFIQLSFTFNSNYIPPFKLRPYWANNKSLETKLINFRKLLNDKEVIEAENITEIEFKDVITGARTNKQLKFVCDSPIAVKVLNAISHLYIDFTPKTISNSKRFVTKTDSPLTANNFYTQKHRFFIKNLTVSTRILFSEINKLFPLNK